MEKKICKKCGRELPLSEFKNNHLFKDGHADTCNCCVARKRKMTMNKAMEAIVTPSQSEGNPLLKDFTPRELIEELKARGYKGKLTIAREIIL